MDRQVEKRTKLLFLLSCFFSSLSDLTLTGYQKHFKSTGEGSEKGKRGEKGLLDRLQNKVVMSGLQTPGEYHIFDPEMALSSTC